MTMKITFHGAARTTTGSMHLVEINDTRILLDCGLYQGRRKVAFERNRNLPFDPASIDKVLLSHAHIDHSGNVPTLFKNGYRGEVFTTAATRDLCDIMLRDSAYLQERDVKYVNKKRVRQGKTPFEPLYLGVDVDETMQHMRGVDYGAGFEVAPGVTATFHDAGHILGSAMITLDAAGKRLLFTGDVGRCNMPILRDPTVVHDVNYLITESTYGNRLHPPRADVMGRLKGFVEDIVAQKARLIIPSFSVGRTQIIAYFLRELHEQGRIPDVPMYVDSPLSSKATKVHSDHPECYDADAQDVVMDGDAPFQFHGLKYITDVEDSKKLTRQPGPVIIISASGMCEGGRILHHLKNAVSNPRNIILIVGYQAEHTLGRRLVEHVTPIKIFGDTYDVEARIHTINALSAHADKNELMTYFNEMGLPVERAFCVHGDSDRVEAMAENLRQAGVSNVIAPEPGQTVEI